MTKSLNLPLAFLALVFLPISLAAGVLTGEWATVVKRVGQSVVFIENAEGSCTGFVINAAAKNKDKDAVEYVLTAAHCDGKDLYAEQAAAKVLAKDTKHDLLVLEVSDLNRPALTIASENPKQGDDVASFGYGWGLERPMLRIAHVSDDKTYIPEDGIGGPLIVIDAPFVAGMSGGCVLNAIGEVVMIVQRGTGSVGIGVGAETIRDKVGRYLPKSNPATVTR